MSNLKYKIIDICTFLFAVSAIYSIIENDGTQYYMIILAMITNLTNIASKIHDKLK